MNKKLFEGFLREVATKKDVQTVGDMKRMLAGYSDDTKILYMEYEYNIMYYPILREEQVIEVGTNKFQTAGSAKTSAEADKRWGMKVDKQGEETFDVVVIGIT